MKGWYVVRTRPNCERLAVSALTQERFEPFFPRVSIPAGDHRSRRVALFPGYVFIHCDIKNHNLPIVSRLAGVQGWVKCGNDVPEVPEDVIIELRRRVETLHRSGGLWERFRVGQLVRVSQGKLEGLAKILTEPRSPQDRVRILLDFMGRQVPAIVPWHSLSPASEGAEQSTSFPVGRRTRGRGRWIRGHGQRAPAQT